MQVKVIDINQPENKHTFPALYRSAPIHYNRDSGELIILFTDTKSGTVIKGNDFHKVGFYRSSWVDIEDPEHFWERLPAGTKIELIQE